MNIHSEICLLDYGGGCELTPNKLRECWRVAESAIQNLCQMLEKSLTEADTQAQKERLQRLQLKQLGNTPGLPPFPPSDQNIPFLQQTENLDDMEVDASVDEAKLQQIHTEAEEAYRQTALDFASGHIAVGVREDNDTGRVAGRGAAGKQAGSLLAAMLKSIGQAPPSASATKYTDSAPVASTAEDSSQSDPSKEGKNSKPAASTSSSDAKTRTKNDKDPVSKSKKSKALDSDEEEEAPMMLTSEFGSVNKEDSPQTNKKEESKADEAEAEIEDLSMAIKSKKSKKKKKSKRK
mmetsp:Transcript_7597/g.15625  ORF Transcript_7597/g.15625 Transcript_7597/m.15625 type:complete len:293 (+) Transcript_7597:179-1057(+)